MNFIRKVIIACCCCILSIMVSYAQPDPPPPCDTPDCDPGGGEPVPVSGIEILLVAGGALGVKRIIGRVRKSKSQ